MSISIPIRVEGRDEALSGIDQSEAFIKIYVLTNQGPVFCRHLQDQNTALTSQMKGAGNLGGELKTQGEDSETDCESKMKIQCFVQVIAP